MAELDGRPVHLDELQNLALTNYGHFTSFRVEAGCVRGLSLHLDRLYTDCQAVFGTGLDTAHVRKLVRQAVSAQEVTTVRVTVFDPSTDLGRPDRASSPRILVTQRAAFPLPLPALTVQSAVFVRADPEIKSVGLFGSLRQRRLAQLNGYGDALFVDKNGQISEGGTWNVGFFDGERVVWPDAPCLPGIAMRLLYGPDHKTVSLSLNDVGSMKLAFATNAAIGVRAISRIDNYEFPESDAVLDDLQASYIGIEPETL